MRAEPVLMAKIFQYIFSWLNFFGIIWSLVEAKYFNGQLLYFLPNISAKLKIKEYNCMTLIAVQHLKDFSSCEVLIIYINGEQ